MTQETRPCTPLLVALLAVSGALAGCASQHPAPDIPLNDFVAAKRIVNPPAPVKIIQVPEPLPLPGQLKFSPDLLPPATRKAQNPREQVREANAAATIEPSRSTFVNAMQVWPYTDGALYEVYTSPERVTDIVLETGEELISVSAGDTVRWVIGDTTSGEGGGQQVHILVKPVETALHTNLIINTSRRTYHLELASTPDTWMASVSWDYPLDQLMALNATNELAEEGEPLAAGIDVSRLKFRYAISGDHPSWRPVRAFDDGQRVYIEFPPGIGESEMPPLFVLGPHGESELVNYRVHPPYYIVDRLFAQAQLRLGAAPQEIVRITRTDLRPGPVNQGGGT
ncbi:MAG: P-type conjugative transfer protein TrbG [Steroidobacteraceae bacterium]